MPVGPGWVGGSHWQYTPIRLGTTVAPWHSLSGRICRRNLKGRNPEASGTFARQLQVSGKETERGGRRIGNHALAGIARFGKSGIPIWPAGGSGELESTPMPPPGGIGDFGVWPGAVPETLNSEMDHRNQPNHQTASRHGLLAERRMCHWQRPTCQCRPRLKCASDVRRPARPPCGPLNAQS